MYYLRDYFVIFNNLTSKDLNISVTKRPSIPSPERRYREVPIEGRHGKLYEDLKTYEDIPIVIDFNFKSIEPSKWNENFRQVKKWINNIKDKKLKFSDDLSFFYVVNKAIINTSERVLKTVGKFQVTFTCEPFMYLESGLEEIPLPTTIYNDYEETQPIYKVTGEGVLTLICNGNSVTANVGQSLIIDTKLGLCFRSDGTVNNVALKGKYEHLKLFEGNNTFSHSQGFTIKLVPNWRCL